MLKDGKLVQIKTSQITVGDIIRISKDSEIPADMILLTSSFKEDRICYVETSNLDGETNLKTRRAVAATADMDTLETLSKLKGKIHLEEPNPLLHQFNGYMTLSSDENTKIPLRVENLLLRGEVLRNTSVIFGVVVYVGEDTKLFKNLKKTKSKFSGLDKKLNRLLYFLLGGQQVCFKLEYLLMTKDCMCCIDCVFGFVPKQFRSTKLLYQSY